jgi:hypothetical protein
MSRVEWGYATLSMETPRMPKDLLSDAKIRTAKPDAKPYKLSDGGGLFLLIQPSGHFA